MWRCHESSQNGESNSTVGVSGLSLSLSLCSPRGRAQPLWPLSRLYTSVPLWLHGLINPSHLLVVFTLPTLFTYIKLILPGPEVGWMWVSIVQREEIIFFFYSKWQEDELNSTSFLSNNDPGAVRPIGVAIGKARWFYTAISAFHCAPTSVDETCEWKDTLNWFQILNYSQEKRDMTTNYNHGR